jgi:hypothetical protein
MDFINQNNISIQDFNTIYPELLKNSDPTTNTALQLIPKFNQLLENDYATGSANNSSLLKNIYTLIKGVVDDGGISESKGSDLVDFMEAKFMKFKTTDETMMSQVQKILKKKKSDIKKVSEFEKFNRNPEKQPIEENKGMIIANLKSQNTPQKN